MIHVCMSGNKREISVILENLEKIFPSMKAASLQLKISGMCEALWSNTGEPGRQVARVFLLCSRTMSFTEKCKHVTKLSKKKIATGCKFYNSTASSSSVLFGSVGSEKPERRREEENKIDFNTIPWLRAYFP